MNKIEYTFIEASSASEFKDKIKTLLVEGWKPQGGIALSTYPHTILIVHHYSQAFIREVEE